MNRKARKRQKLQARGTWRPRNMWKREKSRRSVFASAEALARSLRIPTEALLQKVGYARERN